MSPLSSVLKFLVCLRAAVSILHAAQDPVPGPAEVVPVMPATLSWSAETGAVGYDVYFGTDETGVSNADGPGSAYFLGSPVTSSLPLGAAFSPGRIWWWRVDTVREGFRVKGPVWRFAGALKHTAILTTGVDSTLEGAVSLVMEGDTIISGFPFYYNSHPKFEGLVNVHRRRPGTGEWDLVQQIRKPSSLAVGAGFGQAVAVSGEVLWIGAPYAGTGGQALEYRRDAVTGLWKPTGRLVQSTAPAAARFGSTLAFDGTVLAAGLPEALVGNTSLAGAVDVFNAATLARHVRITEQTPNDSAKFGTVLALGRGFLAIGNPRRTVAGKAWAGAVDVWTQGTGTTWSRTISLTAAGTPANASFGSALAIDNDRIMAGGTSGVSPIMHEFRKNSAGTWAVSATVAPARLATLSYTTTLALKGSALAFGMVTDSTFPDRESVWLHRNTGPAKWTDVAPAEPDGFDWMHKFGAKLALTDRYLAVMHAGNADKAPVLTVYQHNDSGNRAPWFKSGSGAFAEVGGIYRYQILGADEDSGDTLAVTAGAALPDWLTLTDSGNGTATLSGIPPAGAVGDHTIRLRLGDQAGGLQDQVFILKVLASGGLPRIAAVTGDLTSDDGRRVELGVTVEPGPAVTFQWYRQGALLSGMTEAALVFPVVQEADEGTYHVRVTRGAGWVDSPAMRLQVNPVDNRYGGDWPMFGGGPSHSGAYPATLGHHKFIPAWTVPYPGGSPVVAGGGRVFRAAGGYNFEGPLLAAHDLASGALLWKVTLPASGAINPPSYHRGRVYFQQGANTTDRPMLRCHDARTGVQIWQAPYEAQNGNYFSPVVDDNGICMAGGMFGGLYRIGLDGTRIFFQEVPLADGWTPLFHEGALYSWGVTGFRSHHLVTGITLTASNIAWTSHTPAGTVAAAEGSSAVLLSQSEVACLNLINQEMRWKKGPASYLGSPAIRQGMVYAMTPSSVEALDAVTGALVRTYGLEARPVQQPVILDDVMLVANQNTIQVFNLATGTVLQTLTGGGALTYSDGYLLAAGGGFLRAWKVNQPAVIKLPSATAEAAADVPFQWDLTVEDEDGDTPSVTFAGLPAWLSAVPLNEGRFRLSGTPGQADAGAFSFEVRADDGNSFPTTKSVTGYVLALEWTLTGPPVVNPQTGLVEQRLTVRNPGPRTAAGFDLVVETGRGTLLYNGISVDLAGGRLPYGLPLAPGAGIALVLEFYTTALPASFSVKSAAAVDPSRPPPPPPVPDGETFGISLGLLTGQGMLVEFPSQPGVGYQVEYSPDNTNWSLCPFPIRAGGTRVQWTDRGPPFTTGAAPAGSPRFYRIRKL